MKINLDQIQSITNLIFAHIREDLGIHEIELDYDLYWDIDPQQLHDLDAKPETLDIGQLSDDFEFLASIKERDEAVSLLFVHLAPILKAVGAKIGQ